MRKSLRVAMAAITLTGSIAAALPTAASAADWRSRGHAGRHFGRHGDDAAAAAVFAGIAGLVIGAAIADARRRDDPGALAAVDVLYAGGYRLPPAYRYGPAYGYGGWRTPTCSLDYWVYDRRLGSLVLQPRPC